MFVSGFSGAVAVFQVIHSHPRGQSAGKTAGNCWDEFWEHRDETGLLRLWPFLAFGPSVSNWNHPIWIKEFYPTGYAHTNQVMNDHVLPTHLNILDQLKLIFLGSKATVIASKSKRPGCWEGRWFWIHLVTCFDRIWNAPEMLWAYPRQKLRWNAKKNGVV